jgi:hypothetical protein
MNWTPAPESDIRTLIAEAEARMDARQRLLWQAIRIVPQRWDLHPWGDKGGGFWVVAVLGQRVVWYNDIEEGFNRSVFRSWGVIGEYVCDEDDLEMVLRHIAALIETGHDAPRHGPPDNVISPRSEKG